MASEESKPTDEVQEFAKWQAPESQTNDFDAAPLQADAKLKDTVPSLEEATSDEDLLRFFLKYAEEYEQSSKVNDRAIAEFQRFKTRRPGLEPHIYVVKDRTGNVLAGGLLAVESTTKGKMAYFGQKVVAPEARNQNLGPQLVKRRVEAARDAGCLKAYCYVKEDNTRALRSIFKDGFVVSKFPEESAPDSSKPGDPWYLSRDLNSPEPDQVTEEEIDQASDVSNLEEITTDKILVSFENKDLIRQALKSNFLGRQIVLPKDFNDQDPESIKKIKMFMSK